MSHKENKTRSLPKGLLAGLIGGLAGVVAMSAAEQLMALRQPKADQLAEPPHVPALDEMHWSFGVAIGAAYGVAAEYFPAATAKQGATFGLALEAFAQNGTLPALGLLTGSAPAEAPAAITSHVVYGITTEIVRKFVRKAI